MFAPSFHTLVGRKFHTYGYIPCPVRSRVVSHVPCPAPPRGPISNRTFEPQVRFGGSIGLDVHVHAQPHGWCGIALESAINARVWKSVCPCLLQAIDASLPQDQLRQKLDPNCELNPGGLAKRCACMTNAGLISIVSLDIAGYQLPR